MEYWDVFVTAVQGNFRWFWRSVLGEVPWYTNYFYGLTLISLLVWLLELTIPWRKDQGTFRKDFWLDFFYMYFNFFLFSLAIAGFYALLGQGFSDLGISAESLRVIDLGRLPAWGGLLVFFVLLDFVQWLTHRALHRWEWLWRLHQVHHSVKEMGFAAHLRYHWMENLLYKPAKTLGVMILGGFEPEQAYIVHFVALTIGHLNHANLNWTYGPLKYVFNNPVMHLYHHAYTLPEERRRGVNFGISLSLWDYLFGTAWIPRVDASETLGYPGDDSMPGSFLGQLRYGFRRNPR
jgi:sterol desaturase/sphingolipid hydroxylase (fatty acid hydroxylase superfamily)